MGTIASGDLKWYHFAPQSIWSEHIRSGAVGAESFASGITVGQQQAPQQTEITSGLIASGDLADFAVVSGSISPGSIATEHLVSGLLSGFVTSDRIASGTISVEHCFSGLNTSGIVAAGQLGSGAVISGKVASGIIGQFHVSSGAITSGRLGVTGTPDGSKFLRDDFNWAAPLGGDLSSGAVQSGHTGSGVTVTYARNFIDDTKLAGQAISGIRAVTLGSGGRYVVTAERQSGLRMPAIGVSITNAVSGAAVTFVHDGFVPMPGSGTMVSGAAGGVWVGSGGLLIGLSGFPAGASSGPGVGAFSGSLIQQVGFLVSGGIYVTVDSLVRLATVSGTFLRCLSGTFPVSGLGRNVF